MLKEERCDLFEKKNDYWLAHCISSDYALGKGIAVQFNKHFDMKNKLRAEFSPFWEGKGYCLISEGTPVFNLVTKKRYYDKPTYETLRQSLLSMKQQAELRDVTKIAMPLIGCGLDKLEWEKVREIINVIFDGTNIEIIVCRNYSEKMKEN